VNWSAFWGVASKLQLSRCEGVRGVDGLQLLTRLLSSTIIDSRDSLIQCTSLFARALLGVNYLVQERT